MQVVEAEAEHWWAPVIFHFFFNFSLGGVAGGGGGGGALVGTRLQYPPVDRRLRFKARNYVQSIF